MVNLPKRQRPPEKLTTQNSKKSLLHNEKIAENQKVVELILEDLKFILTPNCYSASDKRRRKIQQLQWEQNKSKNLISTNVPFDTKKIPKSHNTRKVKSSKLSNTSKAQNLERPELKSKLKNSGLGEESKQKIQTNKKKELLKISTKLGCSKNNKFVDDTQLKTESGLLPLQLECAVYAVSNIFQQYKCRTTLKLWMNFIFLTREEEKRIRLKSIDVVSQNFIESVLCRSFESVAKNRESQSKQSNAYTRRKHLMKSAEVIQSAWRRYCYGELMLRQELLQHLKVLLDPFTKDNREIVFDLSESDERFIDLCCLICKPKRGRLSLTTPSKKELQTSIKGIRQIVFNHESKKDIHDTDDIMSMRRMGISEGRIDNPKTSKNETNDHDSKNLTNTGSGEPICKTSHSGDNIKEDNLDNNTDDEGSKVKINVKLDEDPNFSVDLKYFDNKDDSYSELSEEESEVETQHKKNIAIKHETSRYQNESVQMIDSIHSDCFNKVNNINHILKKEETQKYAMMLVNAILLKASECGVEIKKTSVTEGINNRTIHNQNDKFECSDEKENTTLSNREKLVKESATIFYFNVHDNVLKSMRVRAIVKNRKRLTERFVHIFFQEAIKYLK